MLVITGPSGVGKGTLIRELRERLPGLDLSVSATTRPPREGELDGRDYHFLSPSEFEKHLQNGDFLEHASYSGHRYGTLRSELERRAPGGVRSCNPTPDDRDPGASDDDVRGVLLEIEIQGARQVREALPEAVQVFIAPPSPEALRERLLARGTDSPEQIEARLRVAEDELAAQSEFEHVIVNDDVERAVAELEQLVGTMWSGNRDG